MLRKLSFLILALLSIGLIGLVVAIVTELALLYPAASMQNLAASFNTSNPMPTPLPEKFIHKLNFYAYATYNFWPIWIAILFASMLVHSISHKLLSGGKTQNFMARIHLLENKLANKEKSLEQESTAHTALLARIEAMYQHSPEAYVLLTPIGTVEKFNPAAERFFKTLVGQDSTLINRRIQDLMPSFTETGLERLFTQIVEKKAVWQGEIQLQDTPIWLMLKFIHAGDAGIIVLFRDISRDHADGATLKTSDALVQQILQQTPEPMAVLDANWNIQRVSPALLSITGKSQTDLINKPLKNTIMLERFSNIQSDLEAGTPFTREEEKLILNEKEVWLKWGLYPWQDASGSRGGYLLFMEDVSELHNTRNRAESKKDAEHALAYQDALTGLPNRQLFNDRFNMALAQAYRQLGKIALFFLDLDGFKAVNDTLGHDAGDMLLKEVATRLKSCVRNTDTVARLGGDEFTIILWIREPKDADIVANKIIESINQPFDVGTKQAHVSTSIGIAIYPLHGEGAADLMKKADTAMYAAKTSGKNRHIYYNPTLDLDNETPTPEVKTEN